jgi:hypothetical protein
VNAAFPERRLQPAAAGERTLLPRERGVPMMRIP